MSERTALAAGVDHEHFEIAATTECITDEFRPSQNRHDGIVGDVGGEHRARRVGIEVGQGDVELADRILGPEGAGRYPPQRPDRRMAVEEAPTAGEETGKVVADRRQRTRRLAGQERGPGPFGSGHPAQAFDRVGHSAEATPGSGLRPRA